MAAQLFGYVRRNLLIELEHYLVCQNFEPNAAVVVCSSLENMFWQWPTASIAVSLSNG